MRHSDTLAPGRPHGVAMAMGRTPEEVSLDVWRKRARDQGLCLRVAGPGVDLSRVRPLRSDRRLRFRVSGAWSRLECRSCCTLVRLAIAGMPAFEEKALRLGVVRLGIFCLGHLNARDFESCGVRSLGGYLFETLKTSRQSQRFFGECRGLSRRLWPNRDAGCGGNVMPARAAA